MSVACEEDHELFGHVLLISTVDVAFRDTENLNVLESSLPHLCH